MRTNRFDNCVLLSFLSRWRLGTRCFGETTTEGVTVQLADRNAEPVIAKWNQAIELCDNRNLRGVVDLFCPDCRAEWSSLPPSETTFKILRLWFGEKNALRSQRTVIYRDSRGNLLAKIYRELSMTLPGNHTRFVTRSCTGILEQRTGDRWYIVTPTGKDHREFGVGAPLDDVRMTVVPTQATIDSWSDLTLKVTFENVGKTTPVALHPQPSFYLNQNAAIVVFNVQHERRKQFAEWYRGIELRSSPPISGLIEWIDAPPRPIQLGPGQKREFALNLNEVCWGCKQLQDGPAGTFNMFLIYDSFLEWNPLPVDSLVWKGRVASGLFRITVKGRERVNESGVLDLVPARPIQSPVSVNPLLDAARQQGIYRRPHS